MSTLETSTEFYHQVWISWLQNGETRADGDCRNGATGSRFQISARIHIPIEMKFLSSFTTLNGCDTSKFVLFLFFCCFSQLISQWSLPQVFASGNATVFFLRFICCTWVFSQARLRDPSGRVRDVSSGGKGKVRPHTWTCWEYILEMKPCSSLMQWWSSMSWLTKSSSCNKFSDPGDWQCWKQISLSLTARFAQILLKLSC